MTAELRSQLTESQLDHDGLEDSIARAHGVTRKENFILFDGQTYKPWFFHRERGLDLSSGAIYLGGVQFEAPALQRLTGGWSLQNTAPSSTIFGESPCAKLSTIFELERLFVGDLGRFEVVRMFGDGEEMPEAIFEKDKTALEEWCGSYKEAVNGSLIGRPVIESDYTHRRYVNRENHDWPVLYGNRLWEELRRLSSFNLRDKYLKNS